MADEKGTSPVVGVVIMVCITMIFAFIISMFVFEFGSNLSEDDSYSINMKEDPQIIRDLASNGIYMEEVQCSSAIKKAYPGASCWRGFQQGDTVTVIIS
jgi:FlaG/FlaF family flagellin (archaellin)